MRKNLLFLFVCGFVSTVALAQPANDNCSGAQSIGTLPTPAGCPSGLGTTTTVSGTLVGATPGNPYIYMPNCTGTATVTASPANDVWYTFVASGYQGTFTVNSTFANPNIALYSGNCASLGGGVGGCAVGSGGTVTLNVDQMNPGTTYYIQISGNTGQTGTFNLIAQNDRSCTDCMLASNLTVTPAPVNGMYLPGQTVNFCYHISKYQQSNTNWLHGVQMYFGAGWNTASLTTNPPGSYSGDGGNWAYYPTGINDAQGNHWDPGFYYDSPNDGSAFGVPLDNLPGNNYGDAAGGGTTSYNIPAAQWNFCFSITVASACNPGSNLGVTINTSGDGESGIWVNAGCASDPDYVFHAAGSCCPPTMSSTPATCAGNNGSATATPVGAMGPYTYSWSGPAGYSNTSTGVAGANTISTIPSGTYTVTITDASLCAVSNTVTVGGNPAVPAAPTTAPVSYCLNATAVPLTATPSAGGTLNWYGTNSVGGIASGTAPTPATSPVGPTTYYVSQTVGGCEGPRAPLVVTINPLPAPVVGSNSPVCVGAAINLTASGGTGYAWTGPNAFASATQNPSIASATAAMAGTYSVTVTNASGCQAQGTTPVVVNPLPVPVVGSNSPVCVGGTINLTASGGTGYTWTGPNAFISATQNPSIAPATAAMAGTYSVTVTDGNGCQAQGTTPVVVNPAPPPVVGSNSPVCVGATINLTCSAAVSYSWTGPNAFASAAQNPSIPSATAAMSGTYSVNVTYAGGCFSSGTTSVTVNPLPVPVVGSNSPVCVGGTINLTASGGTGYAWTGSNAFASATQNPSIASATAAMAGTYSVTVTDGNGCQAQGTTPVVVNPLPMPVVNSNSPVCVGATINLTASGGNGYAWTGPNAFASATQNPSIASATLAMDGVYSVTVTDGNGCQAQGTTSVTINPLPVPVVGNNSPVCVGAAINLTASGGTGYAWTGPNAFTSASQNPSIPSATAAMAGTYSVMVTDASGCQAQGTTPVIVNPLPVPVVGSNSPVCAGATINLTASGGTGYAWTGTNAFAAAIQNPSIASATLAMAGTYSVTVTDGNGCQAQGTTSVTVNPLPVPVVGSNSPVCVGDNINLTASSGTGYAWTGPNAFASATQNPSIASATLAMNGIYSVTVTDGNGCQAQGTTSVTVNPLPVPIVGNNSPVCVGATINLTASGGTGYAWTGPNAFASATQNPSIASATLAMGGTYSVTVTDANGCHAQGTTSVTVNPLPVPVVNNNSPVCIGATINLTASGGTGYAWAGPNAFASATQNPSLASATLAMNGTYSVTVTDANSCQALGTTSVTVNPLPVPVVGSNSPVCVGNNITLTASGGTSYVWTGPNAFASAVQNPAIASAILAMDGTYSVTVTDANGCQAPGTTSVTVNPLPTPTANNLGGPYCVNGTINLTSSPANMVSYNWSGPLGFTAPIQDTAIVLITVPMGGTYTVTVTDVNGCSNFATTSLVVNALPVVTANNNGPVCVGTSLSLSATGGVTYSWTGPITPIPNSNTANPVIPNVTLAAAGTYTVNVTDANGCTNANLTAVSINPNPTLTASTNGPVCLNSTLNFSTTPAFATYSWTGPNAFASAAATPVISPVSAAAAGTYSVNVTDINGCAGTATVSTTINALPTALLNPVTPVCAPACKDFYLSSSSTLTAWGWNFGSDVFNGNDTAHYCYDNPGVYNVSVYITDNNNCSDSVHFSSWVTMYEVPNAEFTFGPNDVTALEPEIHFANLSVGTNITSYSWSFGDPLNSTSGLENPSFTYPDVGYYNVTLAVANGFGCADTVAHPVYIPEDWAIYVPTAFSPNDDGVNDYFFPKGVGIDEKNYKMWIFDRWGNQIYYTQDWNGDGWNGKVQGHPTPVQEDVYVWKIQARSFKGDKYASVGYVTVVR
jgi:gliding motility-associated-like protein